MAIDAATRRQILDGVDRLARERIAPRAAEIDATDRFPEDLYRAAGELGLFGLWIPEEYGGIGPDLVTPLLVSERIAQASASFALSFSNCGDAVTPIVHAATERVKRQWLPGIARGEFIPAFSLTEPQSGSDAASIKSTARRDGDHYVINARKMWCTNGSVAHVYTVFAKTDPEAGHRGVSAFVVPRDAEGIRVGRDEPIIGLRGSPTTELAFEDVRVPLDARLGDEGQGFKIAMITLDEARLNCSAMALGTATAALELAVAYAKERVQFAKPIIQHQGLEFLLARLAAELSAARALWEKAIVMLETSRSPETGVHCAMSKLMATETAMRVTTECVQAMGANGLSRNNPLERMMRDCKPFQVFDGTTQIQQLLIGRYLQKNGVPRTGGPFG